MITKLPIIIDYNNSEGLKSSGKIIFHNFIIEIKSNNLILDVINPYNNLKYIKIPCVNKYNCINYLHIYLPFKIKIINKKLISPYFFIILMNSGLDCKLDFFKSLIVYLKEKNINLSLPDVEFLENNINKLIDNFNNYKLLDEYENVFDYLRINYEYYHANFNLALAFNYIVNNISKKNLKNQYPNLKKITINIWNLIRLYKFSYKESDNHIITDHIKYFSNPKMSLKNIKKNKFYFVEKDKKYFKIKVLDILTDRGKIKIQNNKLINFSSCKFMIYPKNFDNVLKKEGLFNYISNNNFFNKIFSIYFSNPKYKNKLKLISYYTSSIYIKENLFFLKDENIKEYEEEFNFLNDHDFNITLFCNLDINSSYFKEILNNLSNSDKKYDVLIKLFDLYNFPFKYNKRVFDPIFEKIIYFSFLNYSSFIGIFNDKLSLNPKIINKVPIKLKTLYYNIMKIYFEFIEYKSFNNVIFNPKIYNDQIHYEVIKIIFEFDNLINKLFLLDEINYNKIVNTIQNVIILTQLSKRLKWKNLSKNLNYLNSFLDNKNIIFFQDKLNKTIIPINFDTRIKKIISNPFEMFKYLKKEKDFIKWIKFLNNKILEYYNISVIFDKEDYENLGKLIYLLVDVKKQSLDDNSYIKFLNFCKEHENLIIYESRINLRIKDGLKFLKINLNLGYLAKHLTWENQLPITFGNVKNKKLEEELKIISKKYYKYKGKYMKLKKETETNSTNIDTTSFKIYSDIDTSIVSDTEKSKIIKKNKEKNIII